MNQMFFSFCSDNRLGKIWHNYINWEDYLNGMWRRVGKTEHDRYLDEAIRFTGNYVIYGEAMRRVIREWPVSCEQNLTDDHINQKAWVGHAACCLAIGCPEYITREAWGKLTDEQRNLANGEADHAIELWRKSFYGCA